MNQHVLTYYLYRMIRSAKAARNREKMYLIWNSGKLLKRPKHYDELFGHQAMRLKP